MASVTPEYVTREEFEARIGTAFQNLARELPEIMGRVLREVVGERGGRS